MVSNLAGLTRLGLRKGEISEWLILFTNPHSVQAFHRGATSLARINIEDRLFTDRRYMNLVAKMGDSDRALGTLVMAWIYAQRYWKNGDLIPTDVWTRQGLSEALIEVGLAERRPEGIYMVGSEEQFNWLVKSIASGKSGGLRSGQARRRNIKGLRPSDPSATLQRPCRVSNPLNSLLITQEEKKKEGELTAAPSPPLPRLATIWNAHCGHLSKVVRTNPSRDRRSDARMRELPDEEWVSVIQRIAKSKFCNGDNDRGWRATYDWLLQPDTVLKVMEGKYDHHVPTTATDYDHQARLVMSAVSHISSDRWMRDAPEYLGPELWGVLQSQAINISQLRLAPGNEFTIKQLATRLRGGTNVKRDNGNGNSVEGRADQRPDSRLVGSDDPSSAGR